jgi:hypothetical protein
MAEPKLAPVVAAETLDQQYSRLAISIGKAHDADVILYSGGINDEGADKLIKMSKEPNRAPNVFLLLTTRGGSPDAGYRMARSLQRHYKKILLYIHGLCKSAGTLVAIGADELILSDFGEFGPLDVQLGKQDELFENHSGLNITQALTSLNTRVVDLFRESLIDLRSGSRGQLSTKLASEIASRLAIGAYESIYAQVDPVQLGSIERAIQIASEYGRRLARRDNLKPNALDLLVSGYPSHSFVIDIEEAATLFKHVRVPNDTEEELGECISFLTRDEKPQTVVYKLNDLPEAANEPPSDDQQGSAGVSPGSGEDYTPVDPPPGESGADTGHVDRKRPSSERKSAVV